MVIPVREKAFMLAALCLTRQHIRWSSFYCTQRREFNCLNTGICCHLRHLRPPHLVSSCLSGRTQVSCKSCDIPVSQCRCLEYPGVYQTALHTYVQATGSFPGIARTVKIMCITLVLLICCLLLLLL